MSDQFADPSPQDLAEREQILETSGKYARYLAIGHYLHAVVLLFFMVFPGIYLAMGILFLVSPATFPPPQSGNQGEVAILGAMLTTIGGVAVAFLLAVAIINLVAGAKYSGRSGRTFLFVAAGINCLFQPIGLVLGILGILFLASPGAKTLFMAEDDLE